MEHRTDPRLPWILVYAIAAIGMPIASWKGSVAGAVVFAALFLQAGAQLRAIRREMVERGMCE